MVHLSQEKEDGSFKKRAIDHFSWSPGTAAAAGETVRPSKKARKEASVNGHTVPTEKMSHDTIDMLAKVRVKGGAPSNCCGSIVACGVQGTCSICRCSGLCAGAVQGEAPEQR